MVRSIENARSSGRREGVEACLRFLGLLDPNARAAEATAALKTEMQRRTWIPHE